MSKKNYVTLDSTSIDSLYTSIEKEIGGIRNSNTITGDTAFGNIQLESYNQIPYFNISINKVNLHTPIELENILKEERNSIFMLLLRKGSHLTLHHDDHDKYTLKNGELIIYSRIEKVKLYFKNNEEISVIGVRIDQEQLSTLFQNNTYSYTELLKELRKTPIMESISPKDINVIEEILTLQESSAFGKNSMIIGKGLELSGRILSSLLHKIKDESDKKIYSDQDLMIYRKVKEYILKDYSNIPTIQFLSQKFGIGETKLKQGFKILFGQPIFKYITTNRMLDAHRLIEMTNKPISNIAHEIGYSHLSKFSAVFKKHYGYTPRELRKNTLIDAY